MNMLERILKISIKSALIATAITPLVVTREVVFPFMLGKMIVVRVLIECALLLWVIYLAWCAYKGRLSEIMMRGKRVMTHPLMIATGVFFISVIVSSWFAVNQYRAIWGDVERAEGLFGIAHYILFVVMTSMVFQKKDWLLFFKVSVGVTAVASFYGVLQYMGVTKFPFAFTPEPRPGSFIGNSAFFAAFLIFGIMSAGIVWRDAVSKEGPALVWKYISIIVIISALVMIFITGTRGAIVGVGAGVLFLLVYGVMRGRSYMVRLPKIGEISLAKGAMIVLAAGVMGVALFIATKDAPLWQSIPGLNRLATTAFGTSDASTQVRLMTWRLSWEAFKERPLWGWGPDNYLIAFLRHYDPDMALYGETWLDRAHNKIIDTAIAQGAVGLVAYLVLFGLVWRYAWAYAKADGAFVLISAGLLAYFVQNIFLFDQLVGYLFFFAVVGYTVGYNEKNSKTIEEGKEVIGHRTSRNIFYAGVMAAIVTLPLVGYSIYALNYIPYVQAQALKESTRAKTFEGTVENVRKAFYPYNFAQGSIRGQGIDSYYLNSYFYQQELLDNPKFKPLANILIEGEEEILRKEPYDVRIAIRLVEMWQERARTDPEYFKKIEKVLRDAIEIAPKRQELYYHLSFALAKQNKREEARRIIDEALAMSPGAARSHYHKAVVMALTGDKKEAILSELEIMERQNPTLSNFQTNDTENIAVIYTELGRYDKVGMLAVRSIRHELGAGLYKREHFETALGYFAGREDKENFILVASHLAKFPELKEDMEIYIDLAQKGAWDIIHKL